MFVKETYDQRLKNEVSNSQRKNKSNHRSFKINRAPLIGSIKNDKINYDREEQFFSKEDVPSKARQVKEVVKNFIDPDHLSLRKKQWNTSVSVPKKMESQQTQQQKLLKIKIGLLDHPIPKYKPQKIYDGTDTRNDYTKWNVSNEVIRKQMNQQFQKTTMLAFENSKMKEKQILNEYLDPLHKTTNFMTKVKNQWKEKEGLRKELREQFIFDNPIASEQKINAAVFRLAYETGVKKVKDDIEAQAMKTDFKATLSSTQQGRIHTKFNHNGIYQPFPQKQGEDIWAWSCCMNEDQEGRGCIIKIQDGNKWTYSSFNV